MNKTIKIIAILLLVLGALAVVGGVCSAVVRRQMIVRGMPALNQPNLPHFRGGDWPMMDGRKICRMDSARDAGLAFLACLSG